MKLKREKTMEENEDGGRRKGIGGGGGKVFSKVGLRNILRGGGRLLLGQLTRVLIVGPTAGSGGKEAYSSHLGRRRGGGGLADRKRGPGQPEVGASTREKT